MRAFAVHRDTVASGMKCSLYTQSKILSHFHVFSNTRLFRLILPPKHHWTLACRSGAALCGASIALYRHPRAHCLLCLPRCGVQTAMVMEASNQIHWQRTGVSKWVLVRMTATLLVRCSRLSGLGTPQFSLPFAVRYHFALVSLRIVVALSAPRDDDDPERIPVVECRAEVLINSVAMQAPWRMVGL